MGKLGRIFIGFILAASQASAGIARLEVFPVLFVPADVEISQQAMSESKALLQQHLTLAQQHYRALLKTDSFMVTGQTYPVYRAQQPHRYYQSQDPDVAHRIMRELFAWQQDDRMQSNRIYLVLMVTQVIDSELERLGGGRTFNGAPGSGGGYVGMEWSALLKDRPYPFQSTLVHELGHAFGLTHVDCYGYDMTRNDSIMSYNRDHFSNGLIQSDRPGEFNAEELYILSQNKIAFPEFQYLPATHNRLKRNLTQVENCFLGPMSEHIGEITQASGQGYELYFNGLRVNGVEAVFYTRRQAIRNCRWNHENQQGVRVECRYQGTPLLLQ